MADLVGAARDVGRVSLSEIGRRLLGVWAKPGNKRCWRFSANPRVEARDAMRGVIRELLKSKRWKQKPVVIALDLFEMRNFRTLSETCPEPSVCAPLHWVVKKTVLRMQCVKFLDREV